jgi:hypothetical protein
MSPDNFSKLQKLVFSDRPLIDVLCEIETVDEFSKRLVEISHSAGLPITESEVHLVADRARRTEGKPIVRTEKLSNYDDWIPIRIADLDGRLTVEWCCIGSGRLTEPFFDDSIRKHRRKPFNRVFRPVTDIETLRGLPEGIRPAGFIFHMSRCGSTLVSQMLAALDSNIVIAEAPPIDDVLSLQREVNDNSHDRRIELLKPVINAFGRKRFPQEERLFIKLDSWAILDLDVIQKAFPDTPWIFLYREPVEVIVSHMRQPGMQMVPGMVGRFNDLNAGGKDNWSREDFCALVLERICVSALRHCQTGNGIFVDYRDLPSGFERIADHFGTQFTSYEMQTMLRVAEFNAKTPQLFFTPDSENKRLQATPEVLRAASRLAPLYDQLISCSIRTKDRYDKVA